MKVKHWAGYGTVNAKRVNDGAASLHVRVEGNHECGLEREVWDTTLLYNWLVKRFDKNAPEYREWMRSRPIINTTRNFRNDQKFGYVEIVDYFFYY